MSKIENTRIPRSQSLVTESLGFALTVVISVGEFEKLGEHRTFANAETGAVDADAIHRISIKEGLSSSEKSAVVAHEVYHLFYSVRHLITADEETQAEVFGGLVGRIVNQM